MKKFDLSLDFNPQRDWPKALPSFTWKSWLICNFDSRQAEASASCQTSSMSALDHQCFENAFQACHPDLSLSELARVYQKIKSQPQLDFQIDWNYFFNLYKLKNEKNLQKLLAQLVCTPLDFQNWVSEKSLSQGDLAIFRSFNKPTNALNSVCKKIVQLQSTKSQGVKILTLAGELILIEIQSFQKDASKSAFLKNTQKESLRNVDETPFTKEPPYLKGAHPKQWYENLYQLRYPNTCKKDHSQQTKINSLPWPKFTQAKWMRQGDASGVEIRFFAESQKDFQKKIEGLKHVESIAQKESLF